MLHSSLPELSRGPLRRLDRHVARAAAVMLLVHASLASLVVIRVFAAACVVAAAVLLVPSVAHVVRSLQASGRRFEPPALTRIESPYRAQVPLEAGSPASGQTRCVLWLSWVAGLSVVWLCLHRLWIASFGMMHPLGSVGCGTGRYAAWSQAFWLGLLGLPFALLARRWTPVHVGAGRTSRFASAVAMLLACSLLVHGLELLYGPGQSLLEWLARPLATLR